MWNKALRAEFDRAISKRLCRDSRGRFHFLAPNPSAPDAGRLCLWVSRAADPASAADFHPPIPLDPARLGARSRGGFFAAGMAMAAGDRLLLLGNTEEGCTVCSVADLEMGKPRRPGRNVHWLSPATLKPGGFVIAPANSRLGDVTTGPDGRILATWTVSTPDHASTVFIGGFNGRRWAAYKVAEGYGYSPASLMIDEERSFHLAWHDIRQECRYLTGRLADLPKKIPLRATSLVGWAHRAALLKTGRKVLLAYEDYGSVQRHFFVERADGRSRVNPAFQGSRVCASDMRPAYDTSHSQQFALDRYGVPWLFFIDASRQHIFHTRWLGRQWGPLCNSYCIRWNSPRAEDNHLSIDRLTVEERTPANAAGIGLAISSEGAAPRVEFHQVPALSLQAAPGRKVLFFDLQEVREMQHLDLKLNPVRKSPANPVISAGGPEDFDVHGAGGFVRVLKESGRYRMWYSGIRLTSTVVWPRWGRIGYAESADGYAFQRVPLGQVAFRGNRHTNIIRGPGGNSAIVLCDPADPDPARRYKLLSFPAAILHHDEAKAGRMDPWSEALSGKLYTSPDGLRWKGEPASIDCPGGKPIEIIPQSFFRDDREKDPGKRYKAYGFSSLNLGRRGGSYIYSADCIHWTASPQNPVLDAFARCIPPVRGGKLHQIHDLTVWPYGEHYLAFYHYQYDGGRLDVEMAASRDGENFSFVCPGEKLIPLGSAGSFDSDLIAPGIPILDGNEIRIYYGGLCTHDWPGNKTGVNYNRSAGLGTLRLDGFTHLQPGANETQGWLKTIPIDPGAATSLFLNCDCGKEGSLQAELADPVSGRALAGYERKACRRIAGDATARRVTWRDKASLPERGGAAFELRIYFQGKAGFPRLYSVAFG